MKFEIKDPYKGYTIEFSTFDSMWSGTCNEDELQSKNPEALMKKIDAVLKAKKEFTRYDIVYIHWGSSLNKATVTSITDDGEYWVTSESEKRTKLDKKTVIRKYEDVKDLYNEYLAAEKAEEAQIKFYREQIKEIIAKFFVKEK